MDISQGSDSSFPREGAWLGKAGLAAAGLMIGVALGVSISPWTASPLQEVAIQAAPVAVPLAASIAAVEGTQAAILHAAPPSVSPEEVTGMEICWGGNEPVSC